MTDTVEIKRALDAGALRWVRWLDAECFPDDAPAPLYKGHWSLVEINGVPSAFCGWHADEIGDDSKTVGFLARAGVSPEARGRGLQKLMIKNRIAAIAATGLTQAVTYTSAKNAASMNSLIACGFKPFVAKDPDGFVHWRKALKRGRQPSPALRAS